MAAITGIEWADATANFWIGCTKISPACDHCYAEADWDLRKHRVTWGPHGARSPVKAGPIVARKVQREAAAFIAEHGRKPRIFVNSLSDFADNHRSIQPEWREQVWQLARECPDAIFMLLTKRPQNYARYLPADWGEGYPNVWLGTTVENKAECRRIESLRNTPAALRFLSCEPLLEYIEPDLAEIGWVICGGESGRFPRPLHPIWARALRDQCARAGVPFFFKQWGEWVPLGMSSSEPYRDEGFWPTKEPHCIRFAFDGALRDNGYPMQRVGKKHAGRLLDGLAHEAIPAISLVAANF